MGPLVVHRLANQPSSDWKKEELGTEKIGDVTATGTRMTTTIPANAVGNEQPLVITSETWYSPDLKITVRSTHKDPRMGETSVTFRNLVRGEPDPSLFQVPSGYSVTEGGPDFFFREAKKPAN